MAPTEFAEKLTKSTSSPSVNEAQRPWFVTYNPYCVPKFRTTFHWFSPFPADEFHPMSPWEDNVIVSHFGIEPHANAAGYSCVEDFLAKLIEDAVNASDEPRILHVIVTP